MSEPRYAQPRARITMPRRASATLSASVALALVLCSGTPAPAQNFDLNDLADSLIRQGGEIVEESIRQQHRRRDQQRPQYERQRQQEPVYRDRGTAGTGPDPVPSHAGTLNYDQAAVRETQRTLNSLGYDAGLIDGVYGRRTASALRQFQRDHGLPASGDVTPEVLSALRTASRQAPMTASTQQNNAGHNAQGSMASTGSGTAESVISLNSHDSAVRKTQRILNELGYDAGPIDGQYGSRTAAAIRTFQRDRGLPVTGDVTPEVLTALQSNRGTETARASSGASGGSVTPAAKGMAKPAVTKTAVATQPSTAADGTQTMTRLVFPGVPEPENHSFDTDHVRGKLKLFIIDQHPEILPRLKKGDAAFTLMELLPVADRRALWRSVLGETRKIPDEHWHRRENDLFTYLADRDWFIMPGNISRLGVSEFEKRRLKNAFWSEGWPILKARAPQPPIPVRMVCEIRIGEYDFEVKSFVLHNRNRCVDADMPTGRITSVVFRLQRANPSETLGIDLPPGQAEQFIESVRSGRGADRHAIMTVDGVIREAPISGDKGRNFGLYIEDARIALYRSTKLDQVLYRFTETEGFSEPSAESAAQNVAALIDRDAAGALDRETVGFDPLAPGGATVGMRYSDATSALLANGFTGPDTMKRVKLNDEYDKGIVTHLNLRMAPEEEHGFYPQGIARAIEERLGEPGDCGGNVGTFEKCEWENPDALPFVEKAWLNASPDQVLFRLNGVSDLSERVRDATRADNQGAGKSHQVAASHSSEDAERPSGQLVQGRRLAELLEASTPYCYPTVKAVEGADAKNPDESKLFRIDFHPLETTDGDLRAMWMGPKGPNVFGKWWIGEDGNYCRQWDEAFSAKEACFKVYYDAEEEKQTYVNMATGASRTCKVQVHRY